MKIIIEGMSNMKENDRVRVVRDTRGTCNIFVGHEGIVLYTEGRSIRIYDLKERASMWFYEDELEII